MAAEPLGAGSLYLALRNQGWPARMNRLLLGAVIAIVVGIATYAVYVMHAVKQSAVRIAAGRPYCVQVRPQRGDGYKELSSSLELAGFYMRGRRLNHAVLVVGDPNSPELYHWSYFANAFEPGSYGQPPIYCEPTSNYLDVVGIDRGAADNGVTFRLHGYKFAVPEAHEPIFHWPTNRGIAIFAHAPSFSPAPRPTPSSVPNTYLAISFGVDEKITSWRQTANDGYTVEPMGEYQSLVKERVRFARSNSRTIQYYSVGPVGDTSTLIRCFEEDEYQCTQLFTDGEFSFYFHHMPRDLDGWPEIQRRLRSLVSGFIVSRPANVTAN